MNIKIVETNQFEPIALLIEEVQNLHADLLPQVYKPFEYDEIQKSIEPMLSNENCRVFIAQMNGVTIGYILILIKVIPENAFHFAFNTIHIDQLAVAEGYKRIGVGALLMEKVEELAKELNMNQIELDHLETNLVAKNFFKSKGFLPYRSKLMKQLI